MQSSQSWEEDEGKWHFHVSHYKSNLCRGTTKIHREHSGNAMQRRLGRALKELIASSLQEQLINKDLTLQEAETIAVSILKQVLEEKVTLNNVDIAKVAPAYHLYTPQEVEGVISRL